MVTPQVFWLRDNQDENVVAWKVMSGLIDARLAGKASRRQSG